MSGLNSRFLWLAVFGSLFLVACSTKPTPTRAQLIQSPPATPAESSESLAISTSSSLSGDQELAAPQPTLAAPVGPTATLASTATPIPSLTPTPAPILHRLTGGGCCTNPFWSADSQQVHFVDRPASRPLGIYGVDVAHPSAPALVTEWIVNTSSAAAFYVYPDGNTTIVQRAETGEKHVIANGGRPLSVSPDGEQILWQVMEQRGDFDRRRSQIWVANIDGSNARVAAETIGFSESQWVDGGRILLVGLPLEDPSHVAIATLVLDSGELIQLARVARPRETLMSPGGKWLVYLLTFQSNPDDDGLWLVPTDGSQPSHRLDFFGSYRWRDDAHMLYIPLETGLESHTLWEFDVISGDSRRLTDPERTTFKVANNDWSVSPDGRYAVFVSATDHNLWLITLQP